MSPPIELGPFLLDQKVSGGANGDVWNGTHPDTGLPVAIKVLKAELALKERAATGFRNEVRAMAALHHPHIASIFDQGTIGLDEELASDGQLAAGCPYLVMEWASGGTLAERRTPLNYEELLDYLVPLLQALGHAHARGVIHRDLKPANVLFCDERDLRPGLKLADFGLAVRIHPERDVKRLLGTPHYMAPEQWRAHTRLQGPWTDLYALGCLAYRIVTNQGPHIASTIKEMRRAHLTAPVPAIKASFKLRNGFQYWLNTLLAKRPEERFQTAAQALAELPGHNPDRAPLFEDDSPQLQSAGLGLYGLRAIPLVDREPQRVQLWSSLQASRTQGLQVVILKGPAGCGKSRLAEWLCVAAGATGRAAVLQAFHGPTADEGMGLGPMVSRAIQALGIEEDRDALKARIVEWLLGHDVQDSFEVEALAAVVARGRARAQGRVRLNTQQERIGVISRLIHRRCAKRPQLIWLDDVQWAPQALELLTRLATQDPQLPVMVVATVQEEAMALRPENAAILARLEDALPAQVITLQVDPLEPEHSLILAQRLLGMEPELAREVAELSGGNPLFAVQLVAEWVDEQQLEPTEAGYRLLPQGRDQLPANLAAVWGQRLRSLLSMRPDDDRRALEIAAVLGHAVDPTLWMAACERAWAIPSPSLADALVAARLARTGERGPEEGWRFVHAMLRDTLLADAKASGRLQSHARLCAEALRHLEGEPERIARLLELGGLGGAAATELQHAVTAALERGAMGEADNLLIRLQTVLDGLDGDSKKRRQVEAWLSQAELGLQRNQAIELPLRKALETALELGLLERQVRALTLLGQSYLNKGERLSARKALIQAARLRGDPKSAVRAQLETVSARLLMLDKQYGSAARRYRVARKLRVRLSQPVQAARLGLKVAAAQLADGQVDIARQTLRESIQQLEDLGCLADAARAHAQLGDLERGAGQLELAGRHYRKGLSRLEVAGDGDEKLRRYLMQLAPA